MDRFGFWLGVGAASLTAAVDPGVYVLGGGLAAEHDLFLPAARTSFLNNLSGRGYRGVPEFVIARMGNEAGMVGAADSARTRHCLQAPERSETPGPHDPSWASV